ncbi:nitrite reductase small subunit NirD [Nocardioides pelophilus]|uniref:nitrite reductase small subunit NirD n=1 Tax=Nocardioides pelophilus TaxID=2172019 RepID=UPI0016010BBD|nr:nitrite reductase small subunit NirD [Nocardioides pelophilus]
MNTHASPEAGTPTSTYVAVCRLDRIEREGGVTALVGGEAVAIFRTFDDHVYALSNYDPFSKASVLARGIVGTKAVSTGDGEEVVPFVASPMFKQAFDLRSGRCLDDPDNPEVAVATYDVRVVDGGVEVASRRS